MSARCRFLCIKSNNNNNKSLVNNNKHHYSHNYHQNPRINILHSRNHNNNNNFLLYPYHNEHTTTIIRSIITAATCRNRQEQTQEFFSKPFSNGGWYSTSSYINKENKVVDRTRYRYHYHDHHYKPTSKQPFCYNEKVRMNHNNSNHNNNHHHKSEDDVRSFEEEKAKMKQQHEKVIPKVNLHANSPYRVLNVPHNSSHEIVKQAFIQAALVYHPDVVLTGNTTTFITIRKAFEEILFGNDTVDTNKNNKDTDHTREDMIKKQQQRWWKNDTEFQDWLQKELTKRMNQYVSFDLDHSTRLEIIALYKSMSVQPGDTKNTTSYNTDVRGGYWEMARQLTERDEQHRAYYQNNNQSNGKEEEDIDRGTAKRQSIPTAFLSAGTEKDEDDVQLRRRRKR